MTDQSGTTWLSEHCVEGKIVARIGRRGLELVAEFPDVGVFVANADGTRTRFMPLAGVDVSVVEKLKSSLIEALARHLQGKITLHGSAVALRSRSIALLGPSGSGKSTLAAALCREASWDLVADDTIALDMPDRTASDVRMIPTQTSAWLLPDACLALGLDSKRRDKTPVELRRTPSSALAVDAIVGLVFEANAAPRLRRLHGHEAFVLLSGSIIRFVIDDPSAQAREFDQLRVLMEKAPTYELRRPREMGELARSLELVRQLMTPFPETPGGL